MSTASTTGSTALTLPDICERLYWLKEHLKLSPIVHDKPRMIGSLAHICARFWYASLAHESIRPAWYHRESMFDALDRVGKGHPDLVEVAKRVFGGYVEQYGEADRAWKIISVEHEYGTRVGDIHPEGNGIDERVDNYVVTARTDLVVERADGVQFIFDHKNTAGRWGRLPVLGPKSRYSMPWQPMDYLHICRRTKTETGELALPRLGGFIIQRNKYVEPFEYKRDLLTMPVLAYDETRALIRRQVTKKIALDDAIANGYTPSPAYWACWGAGPCDGFDYCNSSNREHTLATRYEKETSSL